MHLSWQYISSFNDSISFFKISEITSFLLTTISHKTFVAELLHNQDKIKTFLLTLVFDYETAMELLQEVNTVLIDKESEYDLDRDFFAWSCGVAKYVVKGHLRDKKRDRHCFDSDLIDLLTETTTRNISTNYDDRMERLPSCLERLTTQQRKILQMYYTDGYSLNEISEILHRKANTLSQILLRIRRLLADCIEKDN